MNKVWLGWTLAGLTAVGFYKFAPSPEDDTVVSRFIQYYSTPKETWAKINVKHLLLSAEEQLDVLTIVDAKRPPVHRFRYPQCVYLHVGVNRVKLTHMAGFLSSTHHTCSLLEGASISVTSL